MTGPTRGVIRVRWARGVFTSELMPIADLYEQAARLRDEIAACGDTARFVALDGWGGRETHIRARDVIAVEAAPDLPDRAPTPGRPVSHVYPGAQVHIHTGAAPDGTAFLRHLAGQQVTR